MPGKKRQVVFAFDEALVAQVVCLIPTRDEVEADHLKELYYTREEFQAQRVAAKGDSRESNRSGASKHLDDVFSEKSRNAQNSLNEWASKGEAARGLGAAPADLRVRALRSLARRAGGGRGAGRSGLQGGRDVRRSPGPPSRHCPAGAPS